MHKIRKLLNKIPIVKLWDNNVNKYMGNRTKRNSKFVYSDSFFFEGRQFNLFQHEINVGVFSERMTERAIELALADDWLQNRFDVCEVGAVTPYYWPGRVKIIIDPYDSNTLVTDRVSLFERSYIGLDVLSISTIEHVGTGDYGLSPHESAIEALELIIKQARTFLLTIPLGYNKLLDAYCFMNQDKYKYCLSIYSRNTIDNRWEKELSMSKEYQYGPKWANAIAVFYK